MILRKPKKIERKGYPTDDEGTSDEPAVFLVDSRRPEEDGAYKKGQVKPSAIYRFGESRTETVKAQAHVYTGLISGCVI